MSLKRYTPLRRTKRLNPVNRKRRAEKFKRNFGSVDRVLAVKAMKCLAAGPDCDGEIHNAHARARGMGGCKGDYRDVVPLCAFHHWAAGENGTGLRFLFERRHGLDLQKEAERIAAELDRENLA